MKAFLKKLDSNMPRHLVYCDVGARWGISEPWKSFKSIIDLVSFEPDEAEYKSLMKSRDVNDNVYQYALYSDTKEKTLNLTKSRGCSSLYKPNYKFLRNFSNSERFEIEKSVSIKTTTLDVLFGDMVFSNIDFIKLDVQGAELDILKGGERFLHDHIVGVEVEVEFQNLYEAQPLFSDVDAFIRNALGLRIQDLRKTYWKYPEGINIGGTKGQLIFGDVLYFRSPGDLLLWCSRFKKDEASNKLVMACLMGIVYGYLDYSLCLLNQPSICEFLNKSTVEYWKSFILCYGKTLNYNGLGSSIISAISNILYRMSQNTYEGWASFGHHLGNRKKSKIFY